MIYTEWDPLQSIVVGACGPVNLYPAIDQIFEETKEDLDNLADYLTKLGVEVKRPNVLAYQPVTLPGFVINNPVAPIVPRDQYLVYGKTVYQTYTSMPDRYFDGLSFYDVFQELFDEGYNWISQPPPLLDTLSDKSTWWNDGTERYQNRNDILWHTATMYKCGDRLITNAKGPGTVKGLQWMERNLDCKIEHCKSRMGGWGHIDHGFFMVDDETIFAYSKDWVPESLRHKNIIEIGQCVVELDKYKFAESFASSKGKYSKEWVETWISQWRGYAQDVCFDTNVLVVDRHNIIFSNEQPKLFKLLNLYKINCHVTPLRHGLFWEGGIHCLTLDLKRKGEQRTI